MPDIIQILREGIRSYGLPEPEEAMLAKQAAYLELLLERNQVMNLTAITEPADAARGHILDALSLAVHLPLSGLRIIDIGSGAGVPGLPLRIYDESIRLTMLDALAKRVEFLRETSNGLGLPDVECLHARAEEVCAPAAKGTLREGFDMATSRAVARLPMLCELCLPFVRVGGLFVAMKSRTSGDELAEAAGAVRTLGGRVRETIDYDVPGADRPGRLIVIEKTAATPRAYPRRFAKIKQSPL